MNNSLTLCCYSQARNYVLLVAFIVGLCVGIIVSERTYVRRVPHKGQPRSLVLEDRNAGAHLLVHCHALGVCKALVQKLQH